MPLNHTSGAGTTASAASPSSASTACWSSCTTSGGCGSPATAPSSRRHSFAISPPDAPQAFFWTIAKSGEEPVPTPIDEWTESTDAAYREGHLAATSQFYYVSPTVYPDEYVNTFGVGAPLAGLPVYAVLDLFVDIEHDRFWSWHGAALTASLLTALFVFLATRGFVQPVRAVLIALAFGLGRCAWPVSSEALWQHPASAFFLSLGAWLLRCCCTASAGRWLSPGAGRRSGWPCCAAPPLRWWWCTRAYVCCAWTDPNKPAYGAVTDPRSATILNGGGSVRSGAL